MATVLSAGIPTPCFTCDYELLRCVATSFDHIDRVEYSFTVSTTCPRCSAGIVSRVARKVLPFDHVWKTRVKVCIPAESHVAAQRFVISAASADKVSMNRPHASFVNHASTLLKQDVIRPQVCEALMTWLPAAMSAYNSAQFGSTRRYLKKGETKTYPFPSMCCDVCRAVEYTPAEEIAVGPRVIEDSPPDADTSIPSIHPLVQLDVCLTVARLRQLAGDEEPLSDYDELPQEEPEVEKPWYLRPSVGTWLLPRILRKPAECEEFYIGDTHEAFHIGSEPALSEIDDDGLDMNDRIRDIMNNSLSEDWRGNPDCVGGMMPFSQAREEDIPENHEKTKLLGGWQESDMSEEFVEKIGAYQIGPDVIPAQCFGNSERNTRAGLAMRNQPLPVTATKVDWAHIDELVTSYIDNVIPASAVREWREENPHLIDHRSKKITAEDFRREYSAALAEDPLIRLKCQVKTNEVLPVPEGPKGSRARVIWQSGRRGQQIMSLPIVCLEQLNNAYFEVATIKHATKVEAMERVSEHLNISKEFWNKSKKSKTRRVEVIEGDGSAWDACCNPEVREHIENRILRHVINALAGDDEVPDDWMAETIRQMKDPTMTGIFNRPAAQVEKGIGEVLRIIIQAVRQSGHRGTSIFNWLTNFILWLSILIKPGTLRRFPPMEIRCGKSGVFYLQQWYVSRRDGNIYCVRYAFEGDDSIIATTEKFTEYARRGIEMAWKRLGFRMKLRFCSELGYGTFTGFNHGICEQGLSGRFVPEVMRNLASSSWTTSALVAADVGQLSVVGAAAQLARALNFKEFGPLCHYFCMLAQRHLDVSGDRAVEEEEARTYGIAACRSIQENVDLLRASVCEMCDDRDMLKLVSASTGYSLTADDQLRLLMFNPDRYDDTPAAIRHVPTPWWGDLSGVPRRAGFCEYSF